ncbi:MAG: hypothetical protein K2X35_00320 [Bryobacteraceae bacterium]|nr:hypothetical protein [Bryobacteraceae bacterium]
MKATDLSGVSASRDTAQAIKRITESHVFERDLLSTCKQKKLRRVVTAIGNGTIGSRPDELVFFLLFELADSDVRRIWAAGEQLTFAISLRIAHHISSALMQLHGIAVAHQDLKPSNVLLFGPKDSKLADLGRASALGLTATHDELLVAGDLSYAPLELMYGHVLPDWKTRRLGCDLYLLGSFLFQLLRGTALTPAVLAKLDRRFRPDQFPGRYEDVLPHLESAFAEALQQFQSDIPEWCASKIRGIVAQLCNLKPEERGHPRNLSGTLNRFSLERYVSELDLLATRAELRIN